MQRSIADFGPACVTICRKARRMAAQALAYGPESGRNKVTSGPSGSRILRRGVHRSNALVMECHRHATMITPAVTDPLRTRYRRLPCPLRRCRAAKRTMNTMLIVVIAEFTQISCEVKPIPEQCLI